MCKLASEWVVGAGGRLEQHWVKCSGLDESSKFTLEDGTVLSTWMLDVDHFVEEDYAGHLTEEEEAGVDSNLEGQSVYDMCQTRGIPAILEGQEDIG